MIMIRCYLVFIIYLVILKLSVEGTISEEDKSTFLNEIIKTHNEYRDKHKVAQLIRTSEMDSVATQILDDMFIGQYNSDYDVYGQIIHENNYDRYTKLKLNEANKIVLKWYEKGEIYNYFSEPSDYEPYKEFTQIVWKTTQWIGIALKFSKFKYVIQIVYYPRGNILGQFKNNVMQRPILVNCYSDVNDLIIYKYDKQNFENYIVYLHNEARIKHGVPILQRDTELDNFASFILNIMSRRMYHYHEMYGKNYVEREYDNNTILDKAEAEAIFFKWYNKGENYNYHVKPKNKEAAEFTQIVWEGTKKIGICMLREEGFYRVLVFYDPPGNIEGEFQSNVHMPRSMEQGESSSYIDN